MKSKPAALKAEATMPSSWTSWGLVIEGQLQDQLYDQVEIEVEFCYLDQPDLDQLGPRYSYKFTKGTVKVGPFGALG